MKNILFLYLFIISFTSHAQIEGTWSGNIELPTSKLPFVLHITTENNTLKATADSPDQGAYGINIQEIKFENNKLFLKVARMFMTYEGYLLNNNINGIFKQGGQKFTLNFTKGEFKRNRPQEPHPPFNYKIEEVTFENKASKIKLAGTLTMPSTGKNFPAIVLVSGSGPQDRNEELFNHKPFWVIADYLTKQGYAVLRYDDRGVGESGGDFENATTFDFADDANNAVDFLKSIKEINAKKIGILGHSEGGMVAQIIAAQRKDIAFIVSMAGPGIAIDELMLKQKYDVEKSSGVPEQALNANQVLFRKIYEIIKMNDSSEKIEQEITAYIKSNPSYTNLSSEEIKQLTDLVNNNWFTTFVRYNPENYFSKIKAKALILNGDKDVQVAAIENLNGWEKGMVHNKKVTIKKYSNLNHLFQKAKTGMPDEYGAIETTIEPFVLEDISNWLNQNIK